MRAMPEAEFDMQIVNPEYREALQLAAEAFQEKGQGQDNWKPLPHIFGSPEYLQVLCQTKLLAPLWPLSDD